MCEELNRWQWLSFIPVFDGKPPKNYIRQHRYDNNNLDTSEDSELVMKSIGQLI